MDNSNASYTTYDLEERFEAGQPIPQSEMFDKNTVKDTLDMIWKDITNRCGSISKFANKYGMAPNYLSEVFSGKKKASRDYYLICFVELGYGLEKSESTLRHLGLADFSVRNPRDQIIFGGIRDGHSLKEINENIDEYNANQAQEDQILLLWTGKPRDL